MKKKLWVAAIFLLVVTVLLMVALQTTTTTALDNGPAYYSKTVEKYQKAFKDVNNLAGWQEGVNQLIPRAKLQRIDFILGELSIQPECEQHDMLRGRLLIFLRVVRMDGSKATIYIDRTIVLLGDKSTGEIVAGRIIGQEEPEIRNGWDGVEI